jgi:hypothetical protein
MLPCGPHSSHSTPGGPFSNGIRARHRCGHHCVEFARAPRAPQGGQPEIDADKEIRKRVLQSQRDGHTPDSQVLHIAVRETPRFRARSSFRLRQTRHGPQTERAHENFHVLRCFQSTGLRESTQLLPRSRCQCRERRHRKPIQYGQKPAR